MNTHQPLVPLATRPTAPEHVSDTEKQTIWHNPTEKSVVLDLHFETPRPTFPLKPQGYEARTGKRKYVIGPGETRALPSAFDMAIQHTQCHHTDCLQRPFVCKSNEEGHEKSIVGGLGPQLINRGTQDMPIAAGFITIAPALDDVQARANAAEQEEFRAFQRMRIEKERAASAHAEAERAAADLAAREERALDAATSPAQSKNPKK